MSESESEVLVYVRICIPHIFSACLCTHVQYMPMGSAIVYRYIHVCVPAFFVWNSLGFHSSAQCNQHKSTDDLLKQAGCTWPLQLIQTGTGAKNDHT